MDIARRTILQGAATVGILPAAAEAETRLEPVALAPENNLTVERRDQVVLLGFNRPYIQNRVNPEMYLALGKALYGYDHDPSLRAAVLFGHGPNFSRGIDVDGYKEIVKAGKPFISGADVVDPLGTSDNTRTKPLIAVCHGDTWNMAHELTLAADIRIAAADTRFGQDENTHGRFPAGGATVRFVRETGWGNAMRYMLTGDHWSAEEAYRMGVVQEVVSTQKAALARAVDLAQKIAANAPLGVKATLASAHLALDRSEPIALQGLLPQFSTLFHTRDFQEGRDAEAQNRKPIYIGR